MTTQIYDEAANSYLEGKEVVKAASCYVKKARSLEVEQWTDKVLSKKLNANAVSFQPGQSQMPNNAQSGANAQPIVELLLKAQQVLDGNDVSDKITFEVGI